ncbi:MAG: RNA-directed DNA polymerase [Candidatus Sungbacteria bacterium]|uniref:RNA-directed DNA polymerase n=1 Tax=Candidatus Sungiibacteriota bacterium TaxID=2750080 RepID=A0A931SDK0_9BACT|nr:RNA-directed DNA polymerase [Candidatus Sungbacteria bacterium]
MQQRLSDPYCYRAKQIPKRLGGLRTIDVPCPRLKKLQRRIHDFLLRRHYRPSRICHSFVGKFYDVARPARKRWIPGRSLFTNAWVHLGVPPGVSPRSKSRRIHWRIPRSLFSVDLKDAYPSIGVDHVFRIYQELTGDPWTAQILSTLSTWNGSLPQGAPTSPLLLNFACRELDGALAHEFTRGPYRLTRYVDDFVLTSTDPEISEATRERFVAIIEQHGFKINQAKTCYWRDTDRALRVTGINLFPQERHIGLPNVVQRQFRAALYYALKSLESIHAYALQRGVLDETTAMSLRGAEKQAWGLIYGVIGFTYQVYGAKIPRPIYAWIPELTARTGVTSDTLVAKIKKYPPIAAIQQIGEEIIGSSP